ncbi:MAG: DUF4159 domain-containing protein [Bacteroidota bacterium]|nr:DUF4159 domain-containing protein [Bacteroidota bacterium]
MNTRSLLILLLLVCTAAPAVGQDSSSHAFTIARVKYDGGGDWYSDPESLPELLRFVRQETLLDVAPDEEVVELTSDNLYSFPYLYLTGHGNLRLSDREADRLRHYLESGGFLHVDDNYGLDSYLRREMKKVFPDREFIELPFDHPIFHNAFSFPNGLPKVHEHDGNPAQGFGLFDDSGRLMVFYTYESDLGDGWEPMTVHEKPEALREAALQMGANILVYAMTN